MKVAREQLFPKVCTDPVGADVCRTLLRQIRDRGHNVLTVPEDYVTVKEWYNEVTCISGFVS